MGSVLVIGAGWAGCAAALAAARRGAEVTLLERTDQLLGTGLVGGIYRNNGRLTALLEAEALGCGHLFEVMDQAARHKDVEFPGHSHAALYDVGQIEFLVRRHLLAAGVQVRTSARVTDVRIKEDRLTQVELGEAESITADIFVDTTGSAGGIHNCGRFGNGCAMCVIRCPSFGPRVSVAAKAGVLEIMGMRGEGRPGSMSGSCKLCKDSLDSALVKKLETNGVVVIPLPAVLRHAELENKACQQYNLPAFKENLVLLDTGHAKMMSSYFPLDLLQQIPGLSQARYVDPYAGGMGNSIRFTAVAPRDNRLKVDGLDNLFCAGEKAGFLVGHTEAVVTGSLAGFNAAAKSDGAKLLTLPDSLACGDIIAYSNPNRQKERPRMQRITFSGAEYFARMQKRGLYLTDRDTVQGLVKEAGLINIFSK
ncbi:FAD-dependent oxidoreductase [Dethiobacter alkaliphilus]|uniref:Glucose-inhibited division protein A n=1 Tax=Dethiobacter alkaliphilus AHT 1 TaxID=555088 RepID=C0GDY2_DETAL|nr:glucose-inhibited division protein A [Dethiobacter alkaliphilus AHT 1]